MTTRSKKVMKNSTIRENNRAFIERLELQRDKFIDVIGVYGPLAAPAVPAILTAMSISKHYPELLGIQTWLAISIGIVSAIVTEILGIASIDMLFDMMSFNNTREDNEDPAPTFWAAVIVGTYLTIVLGLVVLLKIFSELAIVSLIPLTLLGFITVWCIVLRGQHSERKYAHVLHEERQDVLQRLRNMLQCDDIIEGVTALHVTLNDVTQQCNSVTDERNTLSQQVLHVTQELLQRDDEVNTLQVTCNTQNDEITRLTHELQRVTRNTDVLQPPVTCNTEDDRNVLHVTPSVNTQGNVTHVRRCNMLQRLLNTSSKEEVSFSSWADELSTTRQTLSRDFRFLVDNKFWLNGTDWKITDKGRDLLSEVAKVAV